MRILITGADGQLGRALIEALSEHDVTPTNHKSLDITDQWPTIESITAARPGVVIHSAAWTDTTNCERDPARALLVNGEGTRNVAQACRATGATMVFVSTNEVFDGEKDSAYGEDDPVNPVNEYGRSKLAGEEAVEETLTEHYIVRTSWLYGPGRTSFPEKILERARADGRLRVVTDEIASPTWTRDLASAIARLIEHREFGVYHLVNDGAASRKEWAEEIVRLAGLDVPVEPVTQASFDMPFRKPVNSTLANNRAAALGIRLRPWREALADHMEVTGIAAAARTNA